MFYQLDDDANSIEISQLSDKLLTVGFISTNELEKNCKSFGFFAKSVEKCKKSSGFISDIDIFDSYCFFIVNTNEDDRLAVFVSKNLLLLVNTDDGGRNNKNYFLPLLSSHNFDTLTLERLICNFFELILANSTKEIDKKQLEINSLEENILASSVDDDFNAQLLNIKSSLMALRNNFEKLINICEVLSDNENHIFDDNETKVFRFFIKKTERIKNNIDLLGDSVTHLWDSFQAYLDSRLNETMKIFTMITTIFFPLTVIVGWYGMNFHYMPEVSAPWGYGFVIGLSVIVVVVLIVWFRVKRWI